MNNVLNILKKHKILFVVMVVVFGMYIYSKITSFLVLSSVSQSIQEIELFSLKYEELETFLKEKDYSVLKIYDEEYNSQNIIAKKGDETIEIQKMNNGYSVDYIFLNSNIDMTPLISDLKWEDTFFKAKLKVGLNWLNTRFSSGYSRFSTSIHMGQDWILITANDNVRYSYELNFDSSKKLYKLTVTKYN